MRWSQDIFGALKGLHQPDGHRRIFVEDLNS